MPLPIDQQALEQIRTAQKWTVVDMRAAGQSPAIDELDVRVVAELVVDAQFLALHVFCGEEG